MTCLCPNCKQAHLELIKGNEFEEDYFQCPICDSKYNIILKEKNN